MASRPQRSSKAGIAKTFLCWLKPSSPRGTKLPEHRMISRFIPSQLRRLLGVKVTNRPPVFELLDQPGSLAPLLAALESVDEVSLDTEADNMYHYKTRVCLLQFLVGNDVYLVDVLAP